MKTLRYTIDTTKLNASEEEQKAIHKLGQKQLFENILNQLLTGQNPQGISGSKGRTYNRILNKLDKVEGELLELEEAEFELVEQAFTSESAQFAPSQTRLIMQYCAAIDAAKEDSEQV